MSDAQAGENALMRPGMNATGAAEGEEKIPLQKRSKNRRRRHGKSVHSQSAKKSADGIQAEENSIPAPWDNRVSEASGSAGNIKQNKDIFPPQNKGKRARRRKNHRRNSALQATDRQTPDRIDDEPVSKQRTGKTANRDGGTDRNREQKKTSRQRASTRPGNKVKDRAGYRPPNKARGKTKEKINDRKAETGDSGKATRSGKSTPHSAENQKSKQRFRQKPRNAASRPGSGNRRADAYAALDLGTNNCRLLVAVPQEKGRFRVVDAFSRIVRLGEGLSRSGQLSEAAMNRAVSALKSCAYKLNNREVCGVRLIATEACRQASNGAEFLRRVEREAGLKLEIINRETEARLAVAGCTSLVDRKSNGVVLFDIGGGSSELALVDLRNQNRQDLSRAMVSWTSLPLGVVSLSEKYGGGKLVTRRIFEEMVDEVAGHLENFEGRNALEEAAKSGEIHLLGTSGTVTTLAGMYLKLPQYDRNSVDGLWMRSSDIDAMIETLVEMSFEQRVANPCIGRDRADLVLAGCAILAAIRKIWPCPRLRVADRGLREGLLTEMMNADNAWKKQSRHRRPRNRKRGNRV